MQVAPTLMLFPGAVFAVFPVPIIGINLNVSARGKGIIFVDVPSSCRPCRKRSSQTPSAMTSPVSRDRNMPEQTALLGYSWVCPPHRIDFQQHPLGPSRTGPSRSQSARWTSTGARFIRRSRARGDAFRSVALSRSEHVPGDRANTKCNDDFPSGRASNSFDPSCLWRWNNPALIVLGWSGAFACPPEVGRTAALDRG
jgi:hypothetical protein